LVDVGVGVGIITGEGLPITASPLIFIPIVL
jgi:hypothetical protein